MHRPLKFLLFWLMPLFVSANFVNWLGSYDAALKKAHKAQKPLLVLLVKKDSPRANKIIANTFMKQDYVETINEKTVPVIVTYEGKASYPVEMYYTTVFPTLFFVDSQKELILKEPLYGDAIHKENLQKYMIELFN